MPLLKDSEKRRKLRSELYEKLNDGVKIPEALKSLRSILSMSQDDFAKHCGISVSVLRRIEQDKGAYSIESLNRILSKFSFEIVIRKTRKKVD